MLGTAALGLNPSMHAQDRPAARSAINRADHGLALVWGLVAIAISASAFAALGTSFDTQAGMNVWFQGDTPRVMKNMTDFASNHARTAIHPASSILTTPVVLAIAKLGVPATTAAKILVAIVGGANAALMFFTLRYMRLPRTAASIFVALFLSSAAFVHWYACVELAPFASLTITASLFALVRGRALGAAWWVLISAASLSITVTNWSVGLAATVVRWPVMKTVMISAFALGTVLLLAMAQSDTFRNTGFFLDYRFAKDEVRWTQIALEQEGKASWSPTRSIYSLYTTTIVAPPPEIKSLPGLSIVTNQTPSLSETGVLQAIASAAWLLLLGLGIYAGARRRSRRVIAIGVGLMLLGQTALHSVYGDVTFLYAPHFLPMLVVLAALAWFTRVRRLAIGLALIVTVLGGINNASQFMTAASLTQDVVASGVNAPS